jgi:NTP pyrophosphatase (non-canonical NTP hydrolase)
MNNYIELAKRTESPVTPELLERLCEYARPMHAMLGLMTEAGEFVSNIGYYGINLDPGNRLEEIGDLYWYAGIMADALGIQEIRIPRPTRMIRYANNGRGQRVGRSAFFELINACGNLFDVYKKTVFYGRALPNSEELETLFNDVLESLAKLCAWAGFTVEEVMEANIRKLRARYPEKFTELDAEERNIEAEMDALEYPDPRGDQEVQTDVKRDSTIQSCPNCHGILKDSPNDPKQWRCVDCGVGVIKPPAG